jgi:outer membrane protein with beta-barrel domain
MRAIFGTTTAAVLAFAALAAAASDDKKLTVMASADFGPLALDFDESRTLNLYQETGTFSSAYSAKGKPGFEAGVEYRVSRTLGLVAAGSFGSRDSSAHYDASLPHPLYLDANRKTEGDLTNLTFSESSSHLGLGYFGRAGKLGYTLFAGPSLYRVKVQLVEKVTPREAYPYDEVQVELPTLSTNGSAVGFHVGGNLAYPMTSSLGLGLQVRYGLGTVPLAPTADVDADVKAGGPRVALGLRYGF